MSLCIHRRRTREVLNPDDPTGMEMITEHWDAAQQAWVPCDGVFQPASSSGADGAA